MTQILIFRLLSKMLQIDVKQKSSDVAERAAQCCITGYAPFLIVNNTDLSSGLYTPYLAQYPNYRTVLVKFPLSNGGYLTHSFSVR